MHEQHLTVDTGVVGAAGQHTASTAEEWDSWGDRSRTVFGAAEGQVRSARISAALGDYGAGVVLGASQAGQRVSNLGENTTSGAHVVDGADVDSGVLVGQQNAAAAGQSTVLARPVNSWTGAV